MGTKPLLITVLVAASTVSAQVAGPPNPAAPAARSTAKAYLRHTPLTFEPNRGQADGRYQYLTGPLQQPIYFTGAQVFLPGADRSSIVEMSLVGDSTAARVGLEEPSGGISNYYPNNNRKEWRTAIPLSIVSCVTRASIPGPAWCTMAPLIAWNLIS